MYYVLLSIVSVISVISTVFIVKQINKIVTNKYKVVFYKRKTIKLGTLPVDELTLLEWKPLFSLKLFHFYPGEAQEIYHTHSFSAYSFLLSGNYIEAFYNEYTNKFWSEPRNRSRLIFIPKDRFHQITKSEGCWTIMLTGNWNDEYKEYNEKTGEIIVSTHGRKEVCRYNITPNIELELK